MQTKSSFKMQLTAANGHCSMSILCRDDDVGTLTWPYLSMHSRFHATGRMGMLLKSAVTCMGLFCLVHCRSTAKAVYLGAAPEFPERRHGSVRYCKSIEESVGRPSASRDRGMIRIQHCGMEDMRLR